MTLRSLINFVQQNFGGSPGLPDDTQPQGVDFPPRPPRDEPDAPLGERPPTPGWLRQPPPDAVVPTGEIGPWVIEDEIVPPSEPPGVHQWGVDVLAFYKPFHSHQFDWGIYILASGVVYLATVINGGRLSPGDESVLDLAESILREHEAFHFAAEVACSRAEAVSKNGLYSRYFRHPWGAPHEEAMANARAFMYRVHSQPVSVQERIKTWMKGQGPGYRDFDRWFPRSLHAAGQTRAADFMTEPLPPPHRSGGPIDFLFSGVRRYSIPTYWVNDLTRGSVGLLRPLPKAHGLRVITHSNDHPPPHIHIEYPIGKSETRYRWPELVPLKGNRKLPRKGEKALDLYLKEYHSEIESQVQRVYGTQ